MAIRIDLDFNWPMDFHGSLPFKLSALETQQLLPGAKLRQLLSSLEGVQYQIGMEYSKFVNRELKSGEPVQRVLRDVGRFTTFGTKSDYLSSSTKLFAVGKRIQPSHALRTVGGKEKLYDLRSFLGKANQRSSLHFDWNLCPNILYNCDGIKQIELASPARSAELGGYYNFSLKTKWRPDYKIKLGPNEALLIPPLWWHRAHYLTNAWSISFRLRPERNLEKLMFSTYPSWKAVSFLADPSTRLARAKKLIERATSETQPARIFKKVETFLNSELSPAQPDHPFYRPLATGFITRFQSPRRSTS